MNLYNYHKTPEELDHHDKAHESIPKLALDKFSYNPKELEKRKHLFANDPTMVMEYVSRVRKPFPEGEDIIAKSAGSAYWYAHSILRGRFRKGEPAIAKDYHHASEYAGKILRGPFPEAEAEISTDATSSLYYARYALGGKRFIKGEHVISLFSHIAAQYAVDILKRPWPEAEPAIFSGNNFFYISKYVKAFPERAPEELKHLVEK